jgi:hypothetical protein
MPYEPWMVDKYLKAVIKNYGNIAATLRTFEGQPDVPDPATVRTWILSTHRERFFELREQYGPEVEREVAYRLTNLAGRAAIAAELAVIKSEERLETGEEVDPSRAAVNLTRVNQLSLDKMLTLTGRPTEIKEGSDVEGLLRGLVGMGVLKPPSEEPPKQIESTIESTAEEMP